ncbi:MAG: FKBP-type peptidyl-prolyl cis-trans isomerase [Breznakibacter sp.]
MEKVSYSLGISVAQNLLSSGVKNLDQNAFAKGILHGLTGVGAEMSPREVNDLLNEFFQSIQRESLEKNGLEGQRFLEENAQRPGVTVLPSGLQYEILLSGSGPKPKASDRVKCHYHGTLIDGTVFDSSVLRGTPSVFPVNGVIQGWVEALQLMKTGDKWKLFIPSGLAYGERGAGDSIGPNATLVFEVELLEIV